MHFPSSARFILNSEPSAKGDYEVFPSLIHNCHPCSSRLREFFTWQKYLVHYHVVNKFDADLGISLFDSTGFFHMTNIYLVCNHVVNKFDADIGSSCLWQQRGFSHEKINLFIYNHVVNKFDADLGILVGSESELELCF